MADKQRLSPAALASDLLASPEFADKVVRPVLAGRAPAGGAFDAPPSSAALAWACGFLPLTGSTAGRLRSALTWRQAFALVLGDEAFAAGARPPGVEAVAAALAGEAARAIVGALTERTAERVCGWVADRADLDQRLVVDVLTDGRLLSSLEAGDFHREAQETLGGDGRHGFAEDITLPEAPGVQTVVVRERVSGLVLGSFEASSDPASDFDAVAALEAEIAAMRAALARLEQQLPGLSVRGSLPLSAYDAYLRGAYARSEASAEAERTEAAALAWRPRFAVVLAAADAAGPELRHALTSLGEQTYDDWRALLACAPGAAPWPEAIPRGLTDRCEAVEATKGALLTAAANADVLVFAEARGRFAPDALLRLAAAFAAPTRPRLVYADDDAFRAAADGQRRLAPRLKSAFDEDLLLQEDYISPFAAVGIAHAERVLSGARLDHAAVIAATAGARPTEIVHIPRVLYSRPDDLMPPPADRQAVQAHLAGIGAEALVEAASASTLRIRRGVTRDVLASVIVCTRDGLELLQPCVASLRDARSANRTRTELIVVDNGSARPEMLAYLAELERAPDVQVIRDPRPFNWALLNNGAARSARGEVLIFLNDDTEVVSRDWCDALVGSALREDVGAVGGKLLYRDGRIQHAGILVGAGEGLLAHDGAGEPSAAGGYLGRHDRLRRASAVTGACLATRADVFARLDGFDIDFPITNNDVDYCLRAEAAGLKVLYEPACVLYHLESASRGLDSAPERRERAWRERKALEARWGERLRDDPWYNPHFERFSRPFSRLRPPPRI